MKTADNELPTITYVLSTIHMQRMNLLKYNKEPAHLYLGTQEMVALWRYAREAGFSVSEEADSFEGMIIHKVMEDRHIKVTE